MIVENVIKKSKESFGEELPPDPSRVAEGLRDTGYDFNTAISDIVDNSIAANATKIDITFNISPMNEISIYIADNGTGMDENGLKNAMKYGSKQRDEIKSLGKFGLGLKTASTAFCRKLSLVTKDKSTTHLLKMTWDLDHIAKVNKWQPIISTPSKDEIRIFNSIATDDTGTLVIWEKIDRLLAKNPEEYASKNSFNSAIKVKKEKLIKHLGLTYQRFLDKLDERCPNIDISIDMNPIVAIDPFCLNEEKTDLLATKKQPITIDDGKDKYWIILNAYALPRPEDFSTQQAKLQANVSTNTEGFYIYRENRLIHYGDWLGMFTSEPHYSLLRVEFSFGAELDSTFNVDIKKSRIFPAEEIVNWIKDSFISAPRRAAQDKYRMSKIKTASEKAIKTGAHDTSNKVIDLKAPLVENSQMTPIGENEVDLKNQYGTIRHKIEIISDNNSNNMRIIPVDNLENGDLWRPCLVDGKHAVQINQSHPYYQKIYMPILGQKITTTGMDALLWALCEAENSNVNAQTEEYYEDLRVTVSRFLKKLISDLPDPAEEDEQ